MQGPCNDVIFLLVATGNMMLRLEEAGLAKFDSDLRDDWLQANFFLSYLEAVPGSPGKSRKTGWEDLKTAGASPLSLLSLPESPRLTSGSSPGSLAIQTSLS